MIAIDTSAWVEFLRGTGSPVGGRVRHAVTDGEFAVCDVVSMEVLAGARDDRRLSDLRALLAGGSVLATERIDFEQAAELYRICRRNGSTIRRMIGCLIAARVIRAGLPILHADGDFASMARHTALATVDA